MNTRDCDDEKRKAELAQLMKNACHLDSPENYQGFWQGYAEIDIPVVLRADWSAVESLVKQIDTLSETRNHDLRRLASRTVTEYRWHVRKDGHFTEDVAVTGPCVLLGRDPRRAFDLAEYTIEEVAAKHLAKHTRCDVGAVHERAIFSRNAEHTIKAIFGEYVCLYKSCVDCLVWLNGLGDAQECLDFSLTNPVEASVYSTHVAT